MVIEALPTNLVDEVRAARVEQVALAALVAREELVESVEREDPAGPVAQAA